MSQPVSQPASQPGPQLLVANQPVNKSPAARSQSSEQQPSPTKSRNNRRRQRKKARKSGSAYTELPSTKAQQVSKEIKVARRAAGKRNPDLLAVKDGPPAIQEEEPGWRHEGTWDEEQGVVVRPGGAGGQVQVGGAREEGDEETRDGIERGPNGKDQPGNHDREVLVSDDTPRQQQSEGTPPAASTQELPPAQLQATQQSAGPSEEGLRPQQSQLSQGTAAVQPSQHVSTTDTHAQRRIAGLKGLATRRANDATRLTTLSKVLPAFNESLPSDDLLLSLHHHAATFWSAHGVLTGPPRKSGTPWMTKKRATLIQGGAIAGVAMEGDEDSDGTSYHLRPNGNGRAGNTAGTANVMADEDEADEDDEEAPTSPTKRIKLNPRTRRRSARIAANAITIATNAARERAAMTRLQTVLGEMDHLRSGGGRQSRHERRDSDNESDRQDRSRASSSELSSGLEDAYLPEDEHARKRRKQRNTSRNANPDSDSEAEGNMSGGSDPDTDEEDRPARRRRAPSPTPVQEHVPVRRQRRRRREMHTALEGRALLALGVLVEELVLRELLDAGYVSRPTGVPTDSDVIEGTEESENGAPDEEVDMVESRAASVESEAP